MCVDDYEHNVVRCRPKCDYGKFSLFGMASCRHWLSCTEIAEIEIMKEIGQGAVKQVFLGSWHGYNVALSVLRTPLYIKDFQHGLKMLLLFQPNPLVTHLVGWCDKQQHYVTEYHRHGSADLLPDLLASKSHMKFNSVQMRFRFCLNYVDILTMLHGRSSAGVRVMCDSNDLYKLLQQFLVTADLRLVLNDLDALPEVTNTSKIKCGHREIVSDFAAPEQLWPFDDISFSDAYMPEYDEKIDIWKIPDVCSHFLGNCSKCILIRNKLFKIHNRCKENDASRRPSAPKVLEEYKRVWKEGGF